MGSSEFARNYTQIRTQSLGLIRSVAPYFRMSDKQATATIDRLANAVRGWREIANSVGLSRSEQDEMAPAFRAE